MRHIGITLNVSQHSLFSNGVNQNAIYLADLISRLSGYKVYLICGVSESTTISDLQSIVGNKVKCVVVENSFSLRLDVIITVGLTISKRQFSFWKAINDKIKLIHYKCGNEFFTDIDSIIYNEDRSRHDWEFAPKPDQIWVIPQMERTNIDYYSIIHNQRRATVVPFVWAPLVIEQKLRETKGNTYDGRSITRIGIMEPNMSFMKNALIPILISNQAFKDGLDVDILRVFSGRYFKDNKRFNQIMPSLDIYKSGKISLEKRFPIVDLLNKHIDVIVSWQIENNLNYLYLDAAWLGYPVLHNASLCVDVGYYYPNNNIFEGSEILKNIFNSHSSDSNYLERNRSVINRYLPENKDIQKEYKVLLENLFSNTFEKGSYNSKTNTIFK